MRRGTEAASRSGGMKILVARSRTGLRQLAKVEAKRVSYSTCIDV